MTSESNQISQMQNQDNQSISREIYFIVLIPSEEKINFDDLKLLSEIEPEIIYKSSIGKGKGTFLFHNVFKMILKKIEKNEKTLQNTLQYEIGEQSYDISFNVQKETFIYEIKLLKGNKFLGNIVKRNINQNIIPLHYKLDIFLEALKKNNEIDKIEILYGETIELYKKINFSLLISLFLKLYDPSKELKETLKQRMKKLCSNLIDIFKEINDEGNSDRDEDLALELNTFNQIYLNANSLIEESKYDPISFYGIIFCYLSHYDKENYSSIIKNFEGSNKILYEILITYYSHFKNPLNQDSEFYNQFIIYAINKGKNLEIFEIILDYIDDIETFLYVINNNKVDIFKNYDLKNEPLKLGSDLKLIKKEYKEGKIEKTELDNIINIIKELIIFSNDKILLAIYLKREFWKYLLKQYDKPNLKYIDNCKRLRELFKEYKDLINNLYKDSSDKYELNIKDEINRFNDRDEFAFNININIKNLFEIKGNDYNDEEKLGIIQKYNPYYNNDKNEDILK